MRNTLSFMSFGSFLLNIILLVSQSVNAAPPPNADLPDLVEKTLPGVVNVSSTTVINYKVHGWDEFMQGWGMPQERKHTSLGSGFIIDKEGFVLTNYHVVAQADEVVVTLWDKRQLNAKIVGKDQKMDIALLQLRDDKNKVPADLKPVPMGDSNLVRIAESVFAVGNPFSLQHTVTMGIISAKNRTIGSGPFDNYLQTDASINPGNSGGPLFNLKGEVIGINTMIFSHTQQSAGVGFAIPSNEAKKLIPDLKRYGRVPRPWIGIQAERLTPQIQRYYQLPLGKGVLIYNVVSEGPADGAGLMQGDIITQVAGETVEDPYEVERVLAKLKPNMATELSVRRGRKTMAVSVKLTELPRMDNLPQGII